MKLRWTRLALGDLESARRYILEFRPSSLESTLHALQKSLDVLLDHPQIGRPGRVTGTRELVIPHTPFLIPYRQKDDQIELLAFVHHARRWPDKL